MEGDNVFVELAKVRSAEAALQEEIATPGNESEGQLTVDVYQDGDDIVVESAIAGVRENDIDVHIANDAVTIRGKREKKHEVKTKDYFYQECFWGQFSRTVILPAEVDPEKSTATLKNGILVVRMPCFAKAKSKKLKVKE